MKPGSVKILLILAIAAVVILGLSGRFPSNNCTTSGVTGVNGGPAGCWTPGQKK